MELRKEGIYVSVSQTEEGEVILKAVNTTEAAYVLPLEDEEGNPVVKAAQLQVLENDGEKQAALPEPSKITECQVALNGSVTLAPKSFSVVRF